MVLVATTRYAENLVQKREGSDCVENVEIVEIWLVQFIVLYSAKALICAISQTSVSSSGDRHLVLIHAEGKQLCCLLQSILLQYSDN